MYVSGSLKDKTIDFYREKIIQFDEKELQTEKVNFSYQGELSFLPWSDITDILERKQAKLINLGLEKINFLLKSKNLQCSEIQEAINAIKNTSNNITFALFECFYKIILEARFKNELLSHLEEFHQLITYLNRKYNLSQVELDIILECFLNHHSYSEEDIRNAKVEKFHIVEDEKIDFETLSIITFGEFVAPTRVPVIARDLQTNNEFSRYVAPIYFALKEEKQARKFLKLCRNCDLDFPTIEKNAIRSRVPKNLTLMVRR